MDAEAFITWRVDSTLRFARTARSMQRLMVDELTEAGSPEVRQAIHERNKGLVERYAQILKDQVGDELVDADPLFLACGHSGRVRILHLSAVSDHAPDRAGHGSGAAGGPLRGLRHRAGPERLAPAIGRAARAALPLVGPLDLILAIGIVGFRQQAHKNSPDHYS